MSVGAGCERYLTEAVSMACVVGVVMCLFETGGLLFCLVLFWFVLGKIQAWVVLCIAPPQSVLLSFLFFPLACK